MSKWCETSVSKRLCFPIPETDKSVITPMLPKKLYIYDTEKKQRKHKNKDII